MDELLHLFPLVMDAVVVFNQPPFIFLPWRAHFRNGCAKKKTGENPVRYRYPARSVKKHGECLVCVGIHDIGDT